MSDTLVSAIIPTFNRAGLICRAVDSVLQQTYRNVEVVIVDDGSTDETLSVVAGRYGHDARVRYFHVENGGVSRARNIGMAASRGAYIAFLDSDDYWFPWKIDLQVKCLAVVPAAGMIWTDMTAISDDGEISHPRYLRRMYAAYGRMEREGVPLFGESVRLQTSELGIKGAPASIELLTGNIFSQMVLGNLVHTSTAMLRRERFEKVRGFREDLHTTGEDYDFHLRTCREGPVAFINVESIGYTVGRTDQLTSPALSALMAQNGLRTVEPVLVESAHLIRLPEGAVERMLADVHAWAASALLDIDRYSEARLHAWRSICYKPLQRKSYVIAALSLLPHRGLWALRWTYRGMKSVLRNK